MSANIKNKRNAFGPSIYTIILFSGGAALLDRNGFVADICSRDL